MVGRGSRCYEGRDESWRLAVVKTSWFAGEVFVGGGKEVASDWRMGDVLDATILSVGW